METEQQSNSHLFTVRVWIETAEDGSSDWRGRLQHIPSGEVRHFRGWAALIPLMLDILRRHPSRSSSTYGQALQGPRSVNEELDQ